MASEAMHKAAEEESKPAGPRIIWPAGPRIIRLPDWYIKRLQKRVLRRPRPLPEGFLDHNPKLREMVLASKEAANVFFDLNEDILMQVRDKGYAEVMLEYVDGGVNFGIVPKA